MRNIWDLLFQHMKPTLYIAFLFLLCVLNKTSVDCSFSLSLECKLRKQIIFSNFGEIYL